MDGTFDAKGLTESIHMNGGDGPNSYFQNSTYQRSVINVAKDSVALAISEKLNITKPQFDPSNPFKVADFGCSTGQNTIFAMQSIVEAVKLKFQTTYNNVSNHACPEFQVFFNDHVDNDFNTLFRNLTTSRKYFVAGVPGSFYGRLFPEKSLQIVHSSYALQWLSKVPDEVQDKRSLAYNKDKIYCAGNNEMVLRAYVAQFENDMGSFLEARAKKLVEGGLLLIQMPGVPSGSDVLPSQTRLGLSNEHLGESLFDMAKMGYINEEKIWDHISVSPKMSSSIVRSVYEGLLQEHFGSEIMNQLFDILTLKEERHASAHKDNLASMHANISVILKRKSSRLA